LPEVGKGTYTVAVTGTVGNIPVEYHSVEPLTVGGNKQDEDLLMEEAIYTVTGSVVHAGQVATPFLGAVITFENVQGADAYSPDEITASDGSFTFQTVAGSYNVAATGVQGNQHYSYTSSAEERLVVDADTPAYVIPMGLVYRVVGGVLQMSSEATHGSVVGLTVSLLNNDDDNGVSPSSVTSSDGGVFTFPAVLAGTYTLSVSLEGGEPIPLRTDIEVSNGDILDLEIVVPTSLAEGDEVIVPAVTTLRSNYPNPFNPTTTIAFDMAKEGRVSIEIYNVKGQRVRVLADAVYGVGQHSLVWNGLSDDGRSVGSGMYFYRMVAGEYKGVRKMVMIK